MKYNRIAFIGAGNMAASLIGGLLGEGREAQSITAADPSRAARERLEQRFKIQTCERNATAIEAADIVVLAVKPQVVADALESVAKTFAKRRPLLISIAAGVSTASMVEQLGSETAVVRVMPNTPALIGEGMSVLYANQQVSPQQRETAQNLLAAVGLTAWVDDENYLHAVTALSGSGPAYFFYLLEALIKAGVKAGLPEKLARRLALKTGQGACAMALASEDAPDELRRKVTSPGGTTERALEVLDKGSFDNLIIEAILQARQRSRDLSK